MYLNIGIQALKYQSDKCPTHSLRKPLDVLSDASEIEVIISFCPTQVYQCPIEV